MHFLVDGLSANFNHSHMFRVSGFVAQGSPDLILKALSDRYDQECRDGVEHGLGNLTLLFGGGPGDWEKRGLNYLAKVPEVEGAKSMIKRAIGSHYGQVPLLGELAVSNEIEAWVLPMGSISRMIRAQVSRCGVFDFDRMLRVRISLSHSWFDMFLYAKGNSQSRPHYHHRSRYIC